MITRLSLPALGAALCLALPVQALDLGNMSATERDMFHAEVRTYLLENPEVLMEALAVLEQREQVEQVQTDRDLVKTNSALGGRQSRW